ncbi:MAG: glutamate synthase subunit beta [Kofleriaceae bacterium]
MGKPTGFLEHDRAAPHRRPIPDRLRDWHEVEHTADDAPEQAARCMDCGVPFCTNGCPLGNPIPDFADAIYRGRWQDAFDKLAVTNDFPEFTGRVCPAPCEAACVLAIDQQAVTIEALERSISDRAWAENWVTHHRAAPTGKKVAIVGSGPAGLAAAMQLDRLGHDVTIYEADDKPGGLLRYGIPDFKMEKDIIDRRLAIAPSITIKTNTRVGKDIAWNALGADATIIAIGAQVPRDLDVKGRDLDGVVLAMDYLVDQNRNAGRYTARDKHVIILGGGDTGSDCLGTALRQGAASVTQIELVPAPPIGRNPATPWPQWPLVFRTSSSQEEGGDRAFGFRTTHLEGVGKITALHGIAVQREGGALIDLPGTEVRRSCDLLVLAMGFVGPVAQSLTAQLGVRLDPKGNVAVDSDLETNVRGVFCAGDAQRGASLVVWAIAEGRRVARSVHQYLR